MLPLQLVRLLKDFVLHLALAIEFALILSLRCTPADTVHDGGTEDWLWTEHARMLRRSDSGDSDK